jgi:branched-subunit amino acid transport protein
MDGEPEVNSWFVLVAAGLITFSIRLSFIALWGKFSVPDWVQRALRFVPPAVLSAIIVPEMLMKDGALNFDLGNGRLLAGIVAIFVAWKTKNAILTIVAGMAVLLLIGYFLKI